MARPPLRSTRTTHSTTSPPIASTAGQHRQQRAAGGQDVVDQEDALARLDAEASPELAPGGSRRRPGPPRRRSRGRPSWRPVSKARMTPPVVGSRDEVDERPAVPSPPVLGDEPAQLAGRGRILEDLELLDVGVAMAAALQLEVALAEGPGAPEDRFGPGGDRQPRGGGKGRTHGGHRAKSTRAPPRPPRTRPDRSGAARRPGRTRGRD